MSFPTILFLEVRMRKLLLLACFVKLCSGFAQEYPEKTNKLVNDYASLLNSEQNQALEYSLDTFSKAHLTQIAVVIMETVGDYPIEDYTVGLAQKWGVGVKGKNNGILLLVALKDRKLWIATGYGAEGAVTDALARRIIEKEIKPYFKQGEYFQGLVQGTATIMSYMRGEFTADDYVKGSGGKFPSFMVYIILGIIFIVIYSKFAGVRGYARTNSVPFWVAWGLMNAASGRSRGRWSDFSSGSGSFGGFNSGNSGGGFGGFGGGSFGGGGAGGSW